MMLRNYRLTILVLISFSLTACVSNDMSDLELEIENIMKRPGKGIKQLPEVENYDAYAYQSGLNGAKDPFQPFYQKAIEEVSQSEDSGLTPEIEHEIYNRNREELESFELDSLRMVGTIDDESDNWGIVLDPDGTVHRVRVGNYAGLNVGKIINIFEDRIELRERFQNSQGRWEEREAVLALAEE